MLHAETDFRTNVRWLTAPDFDEVLLIERQCGLRRSREQLREELRSQDNLGLVIEHNRRIIGKMIYHFTRSRFNLLSLQVHERYRRRGVASRLVGQIIGRLRPARQTRITALVPEMDLDAHLFLKAIGFRAVNVVPDPDRDGDLYWFEWRLGFGEDERLPGGLG